MAAEKQVMVIGADESEQSQYALEWTLDHFFELPFSGDKAPFKLIIVHAKVQVSTAVGFASPNLKTSLGKKRRDGKSTPLQPLTAMQRLHLGRLIEECGDDYQRMLMDTKLNAMQHSVATMEKLCRRYHVHKDRNPLILTC